MYQIQEVREISSPCFGDWSVDHAKGHFFQVQTQFIQVFDLFSGAELLDAAAFFGAATA